MSNETIHDRWFDSLADPSLSSSGSSSESCEEKYVKHDQDYPDLDKDLVSLKLDNHWEVIKCDHIDKWVTVEAFRIKYAEVFDEQDMKEGLALMKNAASRSRAEILANNRELHFQLYARLIGQSSEYEIVNKYLSSLTTIKSICLLPLSSYWPHPNKSNYVALYHHSAIQSVCFLNTNDSIVFGDLSGNINIYSLDQAKIIRTFMGHTNLISSLSASEDGRWLVSGSWDHTVRIWETTTPSTSVKVLKGHTSSVKGVSITPNGRWIVSGSADYSVRVWDSTAPSMPAKVLRGHTDDVTSVSISHNGRWVASASLDFTVRVWEVAGPSMREMVLKGHTNDVNSVIISPEGRWIVSASSDHKIMVWDRTAPTIPSTVLEEHTSYVNTVDISPDGRWVVSGSTDRTVKVWDRNAPNTPLKVLDGHNSFVNSVKISSDGRRILTSSDDRTVRVWDRSSP